MVHLMVENLGGKAQSMEQITLNLMILSRMANHVKADSHLKVDLRRLRALVQVT